MAIPSTLEFESPVWLRNFRWMVIAGMAIATAAARMFGAEFASGTVFTVLGCFYLWNLLLPYVEHRMGGFSKQFLFFEMLVDVAAVSLVLWHSGGLINPLSGFFIVNVLVAGLLLNSILTVLVSCFAAICAIVLYRAPPLHIAGQALDLDSSLIGYGLPLGLCALIFITTGFILAFLARLTRAQDELRHREKMDALGRLVAGLAHEIGTPLNSILVIARELEGGLAGEQKHDVQVIANQASRCGEIVSLLLGYTRTLVRRSDEVKYTPVAIVPWIQDAYDWLVDAEAKKFPGRVRPEVKIQIVARDVPQTISVPQLILRQVLENLLKNARDAVSDVARPEIKVEVFDDPSENNWIFVVEDNGPGFPADERDKIFEAFFTTKKQGFGSGLGLYISYYLLDQVGGRIVLEGHQGRGARMRVTLPKIEQREGALT